VWQWDDGVWRSPPEHVVTPSSWVVTVGRDGNAYSWKVDHNGIHAQATVGSAELAMDQLRWAIRTIAKQDHVEQPEIPFTAS
jgi:hypothetical protein